MDTFTLIGLLSALASTALCQQYAEGQYRPESDYNYNRQPPPQILTHKQALNHDGNFKYVFTSENGLAQGETIAPDGSRNGGYSYVDPTGRKISVKYTAGKEGFRILEADHLPKAPQPVAVAPQSPYAPQQQQQAYGPQDDGQYRPQLYNNYNAQPRAYAPPAIARPQPISNAIGEREPEYNDEPGKPHSFGSGYIFEFAG